MMIDVSNPTELRREAARRARLRAAGARTFEEPACHNAGINCHNRIIDPIEYSLGEKAIEYECDQLAQKAGARVIRFSHPGKTRQTPGISDRLYCFPRQERALWFECKTPTGEQRPGQVLFEEIVTASGHEYLEGGIGDLRNFLITNGLVAMEDL